LHTWPENILINLYTGTHTLTIGEERKEKLVVKEKHIFIGFLFGSWKCKHSWQRGVKSGGGRAG